MKTKLFKLFLIAALCLANVGTSLAAITVRLDPSSCSSWSTVRLWAWTDEGNLFDSWPGQIVSKDGDGWYAYTFSSSITSVSIIWTNGTDQTVDITGVTSSTCYKLNSQTGTTIKVSVVDCSSGSSQGGTPVSGKYKIGDLYYNLNATNQTAEVTSQNSSYPYWSTTITTANIPSSVTYNEVTYSVTSIGERAFDGCGLTSVTIPNSVTSIGEWAFSWCTSLTSVTIPNSVTSIGDYAFRNCTGLTSVTIPNSVTSIGDLAFFVCTGLTSVTIPNSVTSIGRSAFNNCSSLTSVTIPNSVTSIGKDAFNNCSSLTSVTINSSAIVGKTYKYDSNLQTIFGSQVTEYIIGDDVTSIGDYAFYGCSSLTSVTIPNSVTSIGNRAFSGCGSLTSVTLNSSAVVGKTYTSSSNINIKNIFGSQVTEYIIGDDVTSIGGYAFGDCTALTSVTIGNSVTSIGDYAFQGCTGLTSVTIPNSVTSIGERAFEGCSGLTSVTIGNSVTSIGSSAFSGCSGLTSVTIPNSVTSIGNYAFNGCSGLTSVTIGNSVTSIGDGAFFGCSSLTSVTLNSNAVTSKNYSYNSNLQNKFGSQVTEYIIGDDVTSIGEYAFYNCSGLTSVTIGNSVTSIGERAFEGCSGLTSVTIPNSVTSIGGGAFYDCSGLTSVTIGNSVKSIGAYAFFDCTNLTSVTIPNSVTNIGGGAFYYCIGLTSVTIGNSVTSIGDGVFQACYDLTSVTIPNSVTSIGKNAFNNCSSLTSVTLNSNAVTSKNYSYNSNIKNIFGSQVTEYIIGDDVTSIGDYAFSGCSGLTSVTIGNSVTSIGEWAFYGCSGLTSVTIPNSVTSIGGDAFSWCTSLTSVTIQAETPPTLGSSVFSETNNCPIYVPCNSVSTYKSAWYKYASRILASPNCVTTYTVTFKDWDGTVLKTEQVEEGHAATAPANPTRDGYTFTGWDKSFNNVQSDLIVTAQYTENAPETDNYVVLAQRNATSNWFYMTSDLGTAANQRYQAVDAGTTSLANVNTSYLDSKYYWQIENNKLHTAAGYSTWESGNTAILDETGKELNIEKQTDGTYTFSFADGTNTRYLSLNTTVGNNYFAYYRGTNQIYKLTLVKEGERGTTTAIEEIASQQETQSATKILRNGQIYILRDEKTYTVTGQEIIVK